MAADSTILKLPKLGELIPFRLECDRQILIILSWLILTSGLVQPKLDETQRIAG